MNFSVAFARALPETLSVASLRAYPGLWQNEPELAAMLNLAASGRFDAEEYLERYPDVRDAGFDPIQHFVLHGIYEGRTFRDRSYVEIARGTEETAGEVDKRRLAELFGVTERPAVDELCRKLEPYDVISFDIFDTALLRKVEFPRDIFAIMAVEAGWSDFTRARQQAEEDARELKLRKEGHREITLAEIYEMLERHHGFDLAWMQREIELEEACAQANPYILQVYRRMREQGKIVIFASDMYLPKSVIEGMLVRAGYEGYERLYLSNELKLRKGDGSMQKKMLADYAGLRLIHLGDNEWGDVEQSRRAGLEAIWYRDCRLAMRGPFLNNLAGSLYRAAVNDVINNGTFAQSIHYAHGFICGGILAAGYCQHVNRTARTAGAERILFCGRDCYIIQKVYERHYRQYANSYVATSRRALMLLSARRYADDLLHRFIFRHWDEHGTQLTLAQLLEETGFAYLISELEAADINRFTFCSKARKDVFRRFFLANINKIEEDNAASVTAARKYFRTALAGVENVVIADVGWSGTCIEALECFIKREICQQIKVVGTLVCASDSPAVANRINAGKLVPYVSGPGMNADVHGFLFDRKQNRMKADLRHIPLEEIFSAPEATVLSYEFDTGAEIKFARDANYPKNRAEIEDIHKGVMDFNAEFAGILRRMAFLEIPPYVAFVAFQQMLQNNDYLQAVYGNFVYDGCTLPGRNEYGKVSDLCVKSIEQKIILDEGKQYILLITPELIYTGAPYSLLRAAGILKKLGFEPIIWSIKDGPFRREFEVENMPVQIVKLEEAEHENNLKIINKCKLAWCNTVVTAEYADILKKYLPTVWFIRESGNLDNFFQTNKSLQNILEDFENIYCPSSYAAEQIGLYTKKEISVLHNCVPDQSCWASGYKSGAGAKIKFIQLGTLEYRKGYDVLVKAWLSLPVEYRERSEINFAGGFIASGAPYCEWLFQKIEDVPGIYYHGQIRDTRKKIELMSKMDVVVVASRDESCSLVALEGAMLGKSLIVTENVGAKYMVEPQNGLIVKTGDVEALANAMMTMIDKGEELATMGAASREMYEQKASMTGHERDIADLLQKFCPDCVIKRSDLPEVVISLTSWPGRMRTIMPCIESLLAQDYGNFSLHLWLAEEEFPLRKAELPVQLVELAASDRINLHWVKDNLKPHKKYLYVMRQFPELPVIIVDDDAIYAPQMAKKLMESYVRHPHCVSCHRANMILFREDGKMRNYLSWPMDYRQIVDTPSMRLMPTGVGGVLYPPHALPEAAFDEQAIKELCLEADDLWLKMMSVMNGYACVRVKDSEEAKLIEGSQDVALWQNNVIGVKNDTYLENIVKFIANIGEGKWDICYELKENIS